MAIEDRELPRISDAGYNRVDCAGVEDAGLGVGKEGRRDDGGGVVNKTAMFKSQTVEWPTPKHLYDQLNREFGFDFDPCPLGGSVDGTARLTNSWAGKRVFCNPPYGPHLRAFLECARDAQLAVFLIPARTDVKWFHEIVLPHAHEIRFVKGRLKFGDATTSAPFPSMIVIFKGDGK
jgi:hypothetical protein